MNSSSNTLFEKMEDLKKYLLDSDPLIFGTPVHSTAVTAPTPTFLERICWVFAKLSGSMLTIKRLPVPRSKKSEKLLS